MSPRWLRVLLPCALFACADDPEPATSTTGYELRELGSQEVAGGRLVRAQQLIDGMPIYQHEIRRLIRDDGSVITTGDEQVHRKQRSGATFAASVADEARAIARATPAGKAVDQARARKVWVARGEQLIAAWVVEAYIGDDLRRTIIAGDGRVLSDESLVADAAFDYRVFADPTTKLPFDGPTVDSTPHPTGTPDGSFPAYVAPNLVRVESLNKHNDPWLTIDATTSAGNNVDAYVDLSAPSGLGSGDFRATANGGVFDHVYDPTKGPLETQTQQMASVTSLFYAINWLHDFWYDAGFDEVAGNAQALNYFRGGLDGDVLLAEAQDNALGGSRNNANMATPDDGMSPRMQVFLWNGRDTRTMTLSPSNRMPVTGASVFGVKNFSITGDLVLGQDGMGMNPTDGCTAYTNNVANKIVLVDRGNCTFKTKVVNAQMQGALGVIIANNIASTTPPVLGDDSTLATPATIPVVSVIQDEGATIKSELAAGTVSATISREVEPELDGALDSTLIAHEFGHYLHHRLAFCGNTTCRALSEGWGDFTALMLLARPGDDLTGAYPFSVYTTQSYASDAAYFGIRRAPYSVDFDINALTFRHMADREPLPTHHPIVASNSNSEVHNAGEIWAAALWEVYVALQQAGPQNGETFADVRSKMAKYVVAGLQLTPLEATPMEARDAILAVALAARPADHRIMIEAFARRGFGSCAVAPPRSTVDFVGLVESKVVAGNAKMSKLDIVDGCDDDSILDTGETARVQIVVANQGHAPLTGVSFTLTSQLPGVTVLSPARYINRLEPFSTFALEVDVAFEAGVTDAVAGDLALQVTAAGGCEQTVKIPIASRLNVDDVPAASTTDTFDAGWSPWEPWAIAWSHDRPTPLEGHWHADDLPINSDTNLLSPRLRAQADKPLAFSFRHRHSFEASNNVSWDGAVVEYTIDDGSTWQDVATIASPGYNGSISDESSNPLSGRLAFVATNTSWPDFDTVTVDLGDALAGQDFRLRFRIATDGATGAAGWDIDDVAFEGVEGKPFPIQVADDGDCSPRKPPEEDYIVSGGGGCCESGRSSNGVLALLVLLALRARRRR